jgi:stage V sporulation protein AB
MEWMKQILLGIVGLAGGFSVSGGVFTTLIAVGLIPRFAGKTHTAKHIFLYEEMVVCGTILGGLISVFFPFLDVVGFAGRIPLLEGVYPYVGTLLLVIYGLFDGIFVGCLALAIAEMLDSIPIFARRMKFRHGIGIVILCMAIGKTVGSLIYFGKEFF